MRALFDTNILLDLGLARKPFAEAAEMDCILTRNADDFKKFPVPALSPETFLQQVHGS